MTGVSTRVLARLADLIRLRGHADRLLVDALSATLNRDALGMPRRMKDQAE